jgi:hypothetical protein
MAVAPGHLIGQIIGNVLEEALKPFLQEIAANHNLYLDSAGPRPGVRDGTKVAWQDNLGNVHDLDFVLERAGSKTERGVPAAFVESAWRRYTKHSRAKAQEIQGAVLPLVTRWANVGPVPATVVAGEWSAPSLTQLRSSGFVVCHLNFAATVSVFAKFGIDIRGGGEGTSDSFWRQEVDKLLKLSAQDRKELSNQLRSDNFTKLAIFAEELKKHISQKINYVLVLPLHGSSSTFSTVEEAVREVMAYDTTSGSHPLVRFEVRIVYTNSDVINASFGVAADAVAFLETFST